MFIKKKISIANTFFLNMIGLTLFSTAALGYFCIHYEYSRFGKEAASIRNEYIESQKQLIKDQVEYAVEHIDYHRSLAEERLKAKIKKRVDNAFNTANHIYEKYKDMEKESEIRERIRDALRPLRWRNGNSYVWITSYSGHSVLSPAYPSREGKSLLHIRDSAGNHTVRNQIRMVRQNGQGFTRDNFPRPDRQKDKTFEQIAYLRAFSPFDWLIGSAEFVEDVENDIRKEILSHLVNVRFGKEGYLFGSTYDGDPLFSNGKITLGSDNIWNLTDPNGVKIIQKEREIVKNPDGGYFHYMWKKLTDSAPAPKISFVKGVPDWQWIIGTGVYIDDIEKVILEKKHILWNEVKQRIRTIFFFLIAQCLLIIVIAKYISYKARKSFDIFSSFFSDAATKATKIRAEDLHFSEFSALADAASQMVRARISAEKKLREGEETYRNLFQNAQVGLFRTKPGEGVFAECNDAIARMFGYNDREDFIRNYSLKDGYVDDGVREKMLSLIRAHGKIRNYEARFRRKDGKVLWLRYSARYYPEQDWIEGVAEDVTARKKAEAERRTLRKKLSRSKKMEALGLLAGGVAHDLNNILSGIVSYPELLLMDIPEGNRLRKPIEAIREAGQRAAAVVSDLLTVARGIASPKTPLNLNDLVREYLDSPECKEIMAKHGAISVSPQLETSLPNICGSAIHIRKTLMNLFVNACEAISGNGQILIFTRNCHPDEPLRGYEEVRPGDYVVLTVFDNGSGISPEDLEQIFEPFYTRKVMGRSGTGLGLAVVWNTVRDHDGYIHVSSDEAGTAFEIYFPATLDGTTGSREEIPIEAYTGKGEKILVVDDEPHQREIAHCLLSRLGYQVRTLAGGEEAVEYLTHNSADLVMLDMIMAPGMNGRETYEQIINIHPGQKAILVSGFAETRDIEKAKGLGASHYIKKPYTLEKIGMAIREALEISGPEAEERM